jgi:prepilin signal peptidase PulO-like enzyme (type II secretory pathway)
VISLFYTSIIFFAGVAWGMVLNGIATWGTQQQASAYPSYCPIRWYPFIELMSGLWAVTLLHLTNPLYLPALFLLSSALIVTIRTDAEHFLILRLCSLGIIPFGMLAASFGFLPITLPMSILGTIIGASYLILMRLFFLSWKGYEGLGQGDIELIAAIGSFVGPITVIHVILVASCLGTCYGIMLLVLSRTITLQSPIPFGVFLALGTGVMLLLLRLGFLS